MPTDARRQAAACPTEPTSMHELWERVEAEWETIPVQVCIGLAESMARRTAAVAGAEGGATEGG
jgi:hypothetical protein